MFRGAGSAVLRGPSLGRGLAALGLIGLWVLVFVGDRGELRGGFPLGLAGGEFGGKGLAGDAWGLIGDCCLTGDLLLLRGLMR